MWTKVTSELLMAQITTKWQLKLQKLICILMCSSHTHLTFVCSEVKLTNCHINLWQPQPTRSRIDDKYPLRTVCEFHTGPTGDTGSGWRRTAPGYLVVEQWGGSSIADLWDCPLGWGHHALHKRFWHRQFSSPLDVAGVAQLVQIFSENILNIDIT